MYADLENPHDVWKKGKKSSFRGMCIELAKFLKPYQFKKKKSKYLKQIHLTKRKCQKSYEPTC